MSLQDSNVDSHRFAFPGRTHSRPYQNLQKSSSVTMTCARSTPPNAAQADGNPLFPRDGPRQGLGLTPHINTQSGSPSMRSWLGFDVRSFTSIGHARAETWSCELFFFLSWVWWANRHPNAIDTHTLEKCFMRSKLVCVAISTLMSTGLGEFGPQMPVQP